MIDALRGRPHERKMLFKDRVEVETLQLQAKETSRPASHHQQPGRGKEGFSPESQRGHSPDDTLVLDFQPARLREYPFLLRHVICGTLLRLP